MHDHLQIKNSERQPKPENISGDDELLVVQVISEFVQVVHVRQLLPKLVAEGNKARGDSGVIEDRL